VELVARQFLKAIRGKRSQLAFSRRLGFRSNVCAKWEGGSRMPSAAQALRACLRAGIDVGAAAQRFRRATGVLLSSVDDKSVAAWLVASRGEVPLAKIAAETQLSRFRIARFLSGETRPRLPEFFKLVQALTGRLSEFVALLVDIERVPALHAEHEKLAATRNAMYAHPWTSAVIALLDTAEFKTRAHGAREISHVLGINEAVAEDTLQALLKAGVLRRLRTGYKLEAAQVTFVPPRSEEAQTLRKHWASVSASRLEKPAADDLYSYAVFSLSRADYAKLRKLQGDYYQRVRALISESTPSEVTALISLHLVRWGD
jgi:DNA-binding phage protein